MENPIKVVAAAVVRSDGKILCVRRGNAKNPHVAWKWEFPGGKLNAGETAEIALARELLEELALPVRVGEKIAETRHRYPNAPAETSLETFLCVPAKNPDAPDFLLNEHTEARWLALKNLPELDWAEADKAAVAALIARAKISRAGTPKIPFFQENERR